MPDPKSSVALLLGGGSPEGGEAPPAEPMGSEAFTDAASLLLQAIQENDVASFADALKDAIDIVSIGAPAPMPDEGMEIL